MTINTEDTSNESENGMVINQSVYGIDVKVGTAVTLTIGKYVEKSYNVSEYVYIGQSLSEAIAALESAGLSYQISGTVSGDDYVNYSITGYTQEVKKNEAVKLKVKKNPSGGTTGNTSSDTTGETNSGETNSSEETDDTGTEASTDAQYTETTVGVTDIFPSKFN